MKTLLISLTCILFNIIIQAQDYYPLKAKNVYNFTTNSSPKFFPLKIDSVKLVGIDSVYYLFKQIKPALQNSNCKYTLLGDSWIGETIKIQPNGLITFVNKDKKPFLFKTKASLYEKWTAYQNSKWKAEVRHSVYNTEAFMGILDSIKTYTISITKLNGTDTIHPYDNLQIKISKKYGFIKLVNFYSWDVSINGPTESPLTNLNLNGLENEKLSNLNITGREIYDFKVGDIYQIHERDYNIQANYSYEYYTEKIILTVQPGDTAVKYTVKRNIQANVNGTKSFKTDTVVETYLYKTVSELPFTMHKPDYRLMEMLYSNVYHKLAKHLYPQQYTLDQGGCLKEVIDGNNCDEIYYKGLGGPYIENDCPSQIGFGGRLKELIYYKKASSEEWGTRIISNTDKLEVESGISVSPNPAHGNLKVEISSNLNNLTFTLTDFSGERVLTSKTQPGIQDININSLKTGLYFYQIVGSEKVIKSGKIIIE